MLVIVITPENKANGVEAHEALRLKCNCGKFAFDWSFNELTVSNGTLFFLLFSTVGFPIVASASIYFEVSRLSFHYICAAAINLTLSESSDMNVHQVFFKEPSLREIV